MSYDQTAAFEQWIAQWCAENGFEDEDDCRYWGLQRKAFEAGIAHIMQGQEPIAWLGTRDDTAESSLYFDKVDAQAECSFIQPLFTAPPEGSDEYAPTMSQFANKADYFRKIKCHYIKL